MKDGGTAFPIPGATQDHPGMSLRDWLAGQALRKLACFDWPSDANNDKRLKEIGRSCVVMADVVIAELEKA